MKLNINSKGRVTNSVINSRGMYYLGYKQKVWLQDILYGDNKEIKDWYFELPLNSEKMFKLHDIVLDDYYTDKEKDLLNWLREEYIKEFGLGSTSSIIDTISPI
jgi:hypothetical protein